MLVLWVGSGHLIYLYVASKVNKLVKLKNLYYTPEDFLFPTIFGPLTFLFIDDRP